jgi:protein TonB
LRYIFSTVFGIGVALALFLLMHTLISGDANRNRDRDDSVRLDFIQVDQDEIENIRKRTPPPKPEPPKKPPPPPKLTVDSADRPQQPMPDMQMPKIDLGIGAGSGPYLGNWSAGDGSAEGDVIPIVRIEPQFPREALIKGIEGWVVVEFTIEPDGTVSDPRVVDSNPRRIFDRNAIRAIYKWKFKPRIVDGQPVARRATQRLDFTLNQ